MEYREVFGVVFEQKRNNIKINRENFKNIITKKKDISEDAIRDLIVATITLKYTQSNSIGYAINGQMIGVGAGQQSRVDCAKLAGQKLKNWYLRFHPKVCNLSFKSGLFSLKKKIYYNKIGTKKVDKINTKIHYIENNLTSIDKLFLEKEPELLTLEEKEKWIQQLKGIKFFNINHKNL